MTTTRRRRGEAMYLEVMTVPPDQSPSPYHQAGLLDFVFAEIWTRPGLSRRDRRWVTRHERHHHQEAHRCDSLACVPVVPALG
jgi:hypothetical protein